MTVIVGFDWLSELVIIADTRVSWKNNVRPPVDRLIKLYEVRLGQRRFIFGFSGDVSAANIVIQYLMEYKFKNLKRRLAIATLKDALRGWIEEIVIKKIPLEQRNLSFMLCGIDPSPLLPPGKVDGIVQSLATPGANLYVYTINKHSGKVSISKNRSFAIIGCGEELSREVEEAFQEGIRFGFNQPNLYWARAFITGQIISSLFRSSHLAPSVGGPFQVIRVTPTEIQGQFEWPSDEGALDKVHWQQEGTKVTVHNASLNEAYDLYPVWEFFL